MTLFFLYLLKNINSGYSLELGEAVLTSTHNLYFEQKYETISDFLSENFLYLMVKFSIYLNRRVFVMHGRGCVFSHYDTCYKRYRNILLIHLNDSINVSTSIIDVAHR